MSFTTFGPSIFLIFLPSHQHINPPNMLTAHPRPINRPAPQVGRSILLYAHLKVRIWLAYFLRKEDKSTDDSRRPSSGSWSVLSVTSLYVHHVGHSNLETCVQHHHPYHKIHLPRRCRRCSLSGESFSSYQCRFYIGLCMFQHIALLKTEPAYVPCGQSPDGSRTFLRSSSEAPHAQPP